MSRKDDNLEYQENFEDEVWDEEQWEIFMEEADKRTEEYLKKFEDELLNKKESLENEEEHHHTSDERRSEEERWKESGTGWYDGEGGDSFRNLAIWRTAYHFGSAVQRFAEGCEPAQRLSADVQTLIENCLIISAKIAGGHSMGYDREVLEGNIAYCKRALKAAEDCVDALERIRIQYKPTPQLLKLYGLALKTRGEVREWIEQLRRKIWWR
jgi:hypothetical protein